MRAGVYAEQLEIVGKRVAIVGAPIATLRSPDAQRPLVAFSHGGGGSLAQLHLRPAGDGVVGLGDGQSPPSGVRFSGVTIHGGARGIAGSFGALTLVDSEVVDMSGAGIFVDNTTGPAGCNVSFDHVEVRNNGGGGLAIVGGLCTAEIANSSLVGNSIFGIALDRAGSVHIDASSASATRADSAGLWGDGVIVVDSGPVVIDNSTLSFAVRAGLSSFGCSSVTLTDDELLCDAFALDGEADAGCWPTWLDAGGNACGGCGSSETCQVLSNGLAPPTAIPAP